MKRLMIALVIALAFSGAGRAQDECGNGLPCGPLPFTLPVFPTLISPTPINRDVDLNPNPNLTNTPTPTNTPTSTNTPTPFFDENDIGDLVATADFLNNATEIPIDDIELADIDDLRDGAENFFSYVKGIQQTTSIFGPFEPLAVLFFTVFGISLVIGLLNYVVPFLALVIGLIRKAVSFVIEFIPFF